MGPLASRLNPLSGVSDFKGYEVGMGRIRSLNLYKADPLGHSSYALVLVRVTV